MFALARYVAPLCYYGLLYVVGWGVGRLLQLGVTALLKLSATTTAAAPAGAALV